jgi:antitoxin (DNA-binding transcriptional repressor) of toxin-antitoxin stability system
MARKRPFISATEAAKTFGRLVDRVREERAIYIVERGGKPVAQIGPVSEGRCTLADFVELLRTLGPVDEEYLRAVEAGVRRGNKPAVPRNPWKS